MERLLTGSGFATQTLPMAGRWRWSWVICRTPRWELPPRAFLRPRWRFIRRTSAARMDVADDQSFRQRLKKSDLLACCARSSLLGSFFSAAHRLVRARQQDRSPAMVSFAWRTHRPPVGRLKLGDVLPENCFRGRAGERAEWEMRASAAFHDASERPSQPLLQLPRR